MNAKDTLETFTTALSALNPEDDPTINPSVLGAMKSLGNELQNTDFRAASDLGHTIEPMGFDVLLPIVKEVCNLEEPTLSDRTRPLVRRLNADYVMRQVIREEGQGTGKRYLVTDRTIFERRARFLVNTIHAHTSSPSFTDLIKGRLDEHLDIADSRSKGLARQLSQEYGQDPLIAKCLQINSDLGYSREVVFHGNVISWSKNRYSKII